MFLDWCVLAKSTILPHCHCCGDGTRYQRTSWCRHNTDVLWTLYTSVVADTAAGSGYSRRLMLHHHIVGIHYENTDCSGSPVKMDQVVWPTTFGQKWLHSDCFTQRWRDSRMFSGDLETARMIDEWCTLRSEVISEKPRKGIFRYTGASCLVSTHLLRFSVLFKCFQTSSKYLIVYLIVLLGPRLGKAPRAYYPAEFTSLLKFSMRFHLAPFLTGYGPVRVLMQTFCD